MPVADSMMAVLKCSWLDFIQVFRNSCSVVFSPEEEGPVAESMMVVLKCSWLKEADTERLMRSISLNVSSLP